MGEGDPPALLGEGEGVPVLCGVAVGVASGVAVGLLFVEAEASGLGELATVGAGETMADGVALATGFAFLASPSRTPTRRSRLCFAVKKVSNNVVPKNIPPR